MTLVARGRTDAQIAADLSIGVRTVRSRLDRIRAKTGSHRRADLTRLALQANLVLPGPRCQEADDDPLFGLRCPRSHTTSPRGPSCEVGRCRAAVACRAGVGARAEKCLHRG